MANDVLVSDRNSDLDAHPISQADERSGSQTEVRALIRAVERVELALNPYTPTERTIMKLERENEELRYYCYAAAGLLLFIFLMSRR